MSKVALSILLGLSLIASQGVAQESDEIMYEDEVEYVDEYADEGDEGVEYADDADAIEYADEGDEIADNEAYDASQSAIRNDKSADNTDITRWVDSEADIKRKQARAKKQAQQDKDYQFSIVRQRSGFFMGLGLGYSSPYLIPQKFKGPPEGPLVFGGGADLFLGYQQAFNHYSGIRFYGEFDYRFLGYGLMHQYGGRGNIDLYIEGNMGRNYTETLGFFFGIGGGYTNHQTISVAFRGGLHSVIGTHHRIEFLGQYSQYFTGQTLNATNAATLKNYGTLDFWTRYSYLF
ncbi:hypothetical protein ACWIUD_02745 [Helicobacter sp. 23-1044]